LPVPSFHKERAGRPQVQAGHVIQIPELGERRAQEVRGRESWHTRFTVKGGIPFYKVNNRLESWIDTRTFESLRFVQDLEEGSRDRERYYEIYPERATYSEQGEVERAIRATMTRASADLNRIDYRALDKGARTQYDTAKRFIQQAEDAIRMKNLPFAKNLADKAAVLAAQLGPRQ